MPLLPNPNGLNNWLSSTQADFERANEAMSNVMPAFKPNSGATLSTVQMLSGHLPGDRLDPLAEFFEPSNPWEDTLRELRQAQHDLITKHYLKRMAVTASLDGLIYGLSLIPRATPVEGTGIYFVTKLLEAQRAVLEQGMLQRQAENRASLAKHAIRKLIQADGMPYNALFPLGNRELAAANIKRAQALLRDELSDLDPDMREEVLHGLLDGLGALVDSNPKPGSDLAQELDEPYDVEAAKKDGEEARRATKAAAVILEQKKKDSETVTRSSLLVVKLIAKLKAEGTLRKRDKEKLRDLGKTITEATGAANAVISAAQALGLPAETAADLSKAVAIASNAAQLYMGIKTNPAQAITAAANLITLFAGKKSKDAATVRHEAVMNALKTIFRQNQQIMRNQELIYKELGRLQEQVRAMQHNQAALFELGLATLDAVLLNRSLIIRATSGPLSDLEVAVRRYEELREKSTSSYDMLRLFFEGYTESVAQGLSTLNRVLRSTTNVHEVLLQITYRDRARAAVESDGRTSVFQVQRSAADTRRDEDEQRYALCLAAWRQGDKVRDPRILTEFGSYDCVFDESLGHLDLGLKYTWNGDLPATLLEFGMVWRLGALALRSHHFYQFTSEITGTRSLRAFEDIRDQPAGLERGKDLLEMALAFIDCALAQSYLMTGRFASVDYLKGLWTQEDDLAPRILIELDRHAPPSLQGFDGIMDTHVMALWSLPLRNGDVRIDTTWIDRIESLLPQFSNRDAVMAAVERRWDLQGRIDGFLYQLSDEDQILTEEYDDLGDQAQGLFAAFQDDFFRRSGIIRTFFDGAYEDVNFWLSAYEGPVSELPADLHAIAQGIQGLVIDGNLTLDLEKFTDGRTADYARAEIETLAGHFSMLAKARQVGVDDAEVSEKVSDAIAALSLYADIPEGEFRGGTQELRALRSGLIAALAEYDVSERTGQARMRLNVAIALGAQEFDVPEVTAP